MQLSSCTNLFAIIFIGVRCREVLFVVGGFVTITPNATGLLLCWYSLNSKPGKKADLNSYFEVN